MVWKGSKTSMRLWVRRIWNFRCATSTYIAFSVKLIDGLGICRAVTEFSGASDIYQRFLNNIRTTHKCVACKRALNEQEQPVAEEYVRFFYLIAA
jgi:hypothetical protein